MPAAHNTLSHFLEKSALVFYYIFDRGVYYQYMFKSRVRVRRNSYELITDLIYRIELNLLGKKKEFGKLQPPTAEALSNLLTAARAAKVELERNCLQDADFTSRSRELNSLVSTIDALVQAKVLDIA